MEGGMEVQVEEWREGGGMEVQVENGGMERDQV